MSIIQLISLHLKNYKKCIGINIVRHIQMLSPRLVSLKITEKWNNKTFWSKLIIKISIYNLMADYIFKILS